MRYARTFTVAIVAAAASLLWRPAAAEDFTFNVRVEVSNLASDIDRFQIDCVVCAGRCTITESRPFLERDSTENVIGSGSTQQMLPPAPRNFNGVVRVAFNASPGKVAQLASGYQCLMTLPGMPRGSVAVYGPRPGTPYVISLEGTLGPTVGTPGPRAPDLKGTPKMPKR